ncbi:unnamed protein product, partial [Schistosoma curassoni]|uniref:Uncharacterized protein n=1 Tax=Schistosoma curassoni TaxID=6186 RepID=A0A183KY98_9TREM
MLIKSVHDLVKVEKSPQIYTGNAKQLFNAHYLFKDSRELERNRELARQRLNDKLDVHFNGENSRIQQLRHREKTTLPLCGQPGSDNRPHTSNSTQDHCIHNQPPSSLSIILPTSTFTSKLPFSASPLSVTIANDSSAQNTVPGLLKSRSKLHIGAFNVRTLCQISQQASLTRTLESRTIGVCCVSETRIQDPSVVIHLTSPRQNGGPTRYTLRVSGDPTASSRGVAGVGIALSMRAEQALLEWIPVNSRFCAARLNGS